MWNGFSMISKQRELTEGMLETLLEAERTLQAAPGIDLTIPSFRRVKSINV